MFVTVFPSRSLRRTWIISFTSVIRYYMKSRRVFKPTAYLKKFSILWVVSLTLLQFSDHWNDWLPCSAVWLPQESNDGYCPKPDCACWRACWCQTNCTCRWIEITVFVICNRGKGSGVLLKYLWHLRACGTVLSNHWHSENHEHQNDIWKFLFIVWENQSGKGKWNRNDI